MKQITKVSRKCAVPGCRSVDCFSITRGSSGAVCLCEECSSELYRAHKASAKNARKVKKVAAGEADG